MTAEVCLISTNAARKPDNVLTGTQTTLMLLRLCNFTFQTAVLLSVILIIQVLGEETAIVI